MQDRKEFKGVVVTYDRVYNIAMVKIKLKNLYTSVKLDISYDVHHGD